MLKTIAAETEREGRRRSGVPSDIHDLPENLQRKCVVPLKVAAAMAGKSLRSAHRLIAEGRFPKPVRIGLRSSGFVVGEILDMIEAARDPEKQPAPPRRTA